MFNHPESARAKVHDDQEVPKDLSGTREGKSKEAALSKIVKDISDKRSKRYVYQIDESGRMVQRAIEGPFSKSPAISGPETPKATVGSSRGKRNRNYMYRFDESGVLRDLGLEATEASGTGKSEVTVRRPLFQDSCPVTTREESTERSEGPVWTCLFERPRPATPQPQSQKHTPQPTPQNGPKPSEKKKQKTGIQAMQEALAALRNIGSQWKEVNKTIAAARDIASCKGTFDDELAGPAFDEPPSNIPVQPPPKTDLSLQKRKSKKTGIQAMQEALAALRNIGSQWKEVNKTIAAARDITSCKGTFDDELAGPAFDEPPSNIPVQPPPTTRWRSTSPNNPLSEKGSSLRKRKRKEEKTATQADLAALDALDGIKPTQQTPSNASRNGGRSLRFLRHQAHPARPRHASNYSRGGGGGGQRFPRHPAHAAKPNRTRRG